MNLSRTRIVPWMLLASFLGAPGKTQAIAAPGCISDTDYLAHPTTFSPVKLDDNPANIGVYRFSGAQKGAKTGNYFCVNSYLIVGSRESVLIDAQFIEPHVSELASIIRGTGKRLKAIFTTHTHFDHYYGAKSLLSQFPQASFYAVPEVADEIKVAPLVYGALLALTLSDFPGQVVSDPVGPSAYENQEYAFDGGKLKLELLSLGQGESLADSVYYLPQAKVLFAGDTVYTKTHPYLAENHPEKWLDNLKTIQNRFSFTRYLPGHGDEGDAQDFAQMNQYLVDYLSLDKNKVSAQDAVRWMTSRYPGYRNEFILEVGASKRFK